MSRLGLGVMINMLGGNAKSTAALSASLGKTIAHLAIIGDALTFTFDDGSVLRVEDTGQSCCENRYMTSDDDLPSYIGGTLSSMEVRDAPDVDDGDVHEVQFLVVTTSKGDITCETHNEHNGYYGGFSIECSLAQEVGGS